MARPLRLEYPGALYHVSSRGNGREPIVLDDDDRRVFLGVMASVIKRFNWLCHAYCLMSNHYQLLVETPEANLSRGMRQLNGVYTQRFNRRHARGGHLFQGRFKAIVVDRDSYLLELCRYVVLNPVRVKMLKDPLNYPWSSLRSTAGIDPTPPFLTVDWVLGQFAKTASVARRRYTEFIRSGLGLSSPWEHLQGQILLGAPGFVERLKPYLTGRRRLKNIPRPQRLRDRPSLETLFREDQNLRKSQRNQRIRQAHFQYAYTLSDIARYQGLHYTTVSKIVNAREN